MRIHDAWRRLSEDERRAVAGELAALRARAGWPPGVALALAKLLSFRPQRVATLPDDALADLLDRHLGRLSASALASLLSQLHVFGRAELLSSVYTALGVEHQGADVDDAQFALPLDEAAALAGIDAMIDADPPSAARVTFCMEVMSCVTSSEWQLVVDRVCEHLVQRAECASQLLQAQPATERAEGESLADLARAARVVGAQLHEAADQSGARGDRADVSGVAEINQGDSASEQGSGASESSRPAQAPPPRDPSAAGQSPSNAPPAPREHRAGFTHLDHLLIDAAVASATRSAGSLSTTELDALVREVISLNPKRMITWFHCGFVDALRRRDMAAQTAGGNAESRAWYLSGYVQGAVREDASPETVARLVEVELGDADREVLLGTSGGEAGALMAETIIVPLLRSSAVDQVLPWLEVYLPRVASRVLEPVLRWAKDGLVHADPEPVRRVLETIMRLRPRIEQRNGPMSASVDHDLRRRMAVCWRRAGRFPDARHAVESLLAEEQLSGYERGRLLGDHALIAMGVKAIEDLALPSPDGREAFLEGLAAQRDVLEQAVAKDEAVPSALVALALPAVADCDAPDDVRARAADRLRRALAAMHDEAPEFWRRTGLLRRCRFYLTLLVLREADQAVLSPAVSTLLQMLQDGDDLADDLPRDLVEEAVSLAVLADARASPEVALHALRRRPHDMLRILDLRHLAAVGRESRQAVLNALGAASPKLSVQERWSAWNDLLRGSLQGGDRGLRAAERALDALEELAERHGREQDFLALLEDENTWSPAWDLEDAFDAGLRLRLNLGRTDEAITVLHELAHRAITMGDQTAGDLIERLEALGADAILVGGLRQRLDTSRAGAPEPLADAQDARPVSVLFVGGNETQQAYEQSLCQWFAATYPNPSRLDFRFPGWSSNWGRTTDELTSRLRDADVLVLMRFVRTGLGRAMRRAASEQAKPWVACGGHGRDAMRRAIEAAVERARVRPRRG